MRIETRDGFVGIGEAAPLEPYDGVTLGETRLALEGFRQVLDGADELPGTEIMAACRRVSPLPQALAAIDLALWDIAGKREGRPVAALLSDEALARGGGQRDVGAARPRQAAGRAAAAVAAGFRCVKVKVGIDDDLARVAAVREAGGPDLAIRLDANGTWTVDEAVRGALGARAAGHRAGRGTGRRDRGAARAARDLPGPDRDGRDRRRSSARSGRAPRTRSA